MNCIHQHLQIPFIIILNIYIALRRNTPQYCEWTTTAITLKPIWYFFIFYFLLWEIKITPLNKMQFNELKNKTISSQNIWKINTHKKNSKSALNHHTTLSKTHSIHTPSPPSNYTPTRKNTHPINPKTTTTKPTHSSSHTFSAILQSKSKFHHYHTDPWRKRFSRK